MVVKSVVIVSWAQNQQFIAKHLCEKRSEKNNCCQGKCYLKKQLKKVNQDSESNDAVLKIQKIDCFVLYTPEEIHYPFSEDEVLKHLPKTRSNYSFHLIENSFRPPAYV